MVTISISLSTRKPPIDPLSCSLLSPFQFAFRLRPGFFTLFQKHHVLDLTHATFNLLTRPLFSIHYHTHIKTLSSLIMSAKTAAQEEFDSILAKASSSGPVNHHPEDTSDHETSDVDEETAYLQSKIDENMRMPSFSARETTGLRLPHKDFDSGRTTGVKGVIADARSYEEARRSGAWKSSRANSKTRTADKRASTATFLKDDGEGSDTEDEEFLERWRQQRREELQSVGNDIRNRRTSPSVRRYGRFDEVDAMGYLDAIEKVTRETIVVVFVYDSECPVSQVISEALEPLVPTHPAIHFVRIHYEDIEFDNAGVPAILAYKNQGDLFANLTYIIDQIPDETIFDTRALENILKKHNVL